MPSHDLLFEIGCEELPAKSLARMAQALASHMEHELRAAELGFKSIQSFATPRRLAILVRDLNDQQPSRTTERQGPSMQTAFDKDGTPTLACIGFARSCGVSTDQLQIQDTAKGQRVFCRVEERGKATVELIPEIIQVALKKLPINKPMRWGSSDKTFLRPVHWVVLLYGHEVIPAQLFDHSTQQDTYGHRFHHPKAIRVGQARDYEQTLQTHGYIISDLQKRKNKIRQQIHKISEAHGVPVIDEDLLDEVTGLVEWPVALRGKFKHEFLEVPAEALMTSMKVHQKNFPIKDPQGNLLPYFITISNIESKDPAVVIRGNERVLNARLADAAFFYRNDLKKPLHHFTTQLAQVVFQKSLGSLADRSQRLMKIAAYIAKSLQLNETTAKRAAELAKFDLMSEMVGEFPELQGSMGYYYALHAQESKEVALAIREHYYPRFSGDDLPKTDLGTVIALADRLDLLVGILGINKFPTGEKDPYALKRAALGIVRLLIEKRLNLDLRKLLQACIKYYAVNLPNKEVLESTLKFITERMRSWYTEKGLATEVFLAVQASASDNLLDFDQRVKAVQQFQELPESSALAAANKRVGNILKKLDERPKTTTVNQSLFENQAEKDLAELLAKKTQTVDNLYRGANYTQALSELAALKAPIDTFFDHVMVMVEDKAVRDNRLLLLDKLRSLFTKVADISLLS